MNVSVRSACVRLRACVRLCACARVRGGAPRACARVRAAALDFIVFLLFFSSYLFLVRMTDKAEAILIFFRILYILFLSTYNAH